MNVQYELPMQVDVLKCFKKMKHEYRLQPVDTDFKSYATQVLGDKQYHDMVYSTGYSDYEKAHAYETLFHYGIEDTLNGVMAVMPWKELITCLKDFLLQSGVKIFTSCYVDKLQDHKVYAKMKNVTTCFYGKNIVLGLTIGALRRLLRTQLHDISPYHTIQSQPFVRIYVKIDIQTSLGFLQKIQGYTVVSPPLQKIIPISKEHGIYMIAYADNKNALRLRYIQKHEIERLVERVLKLPPNSIHILQMKTIFWKEGTHYYTPDFRYEMLPHIQCPKSHLFVVGEAFSRNQGWTEGALESVENILPSLQQRL
jgi:hypothetical protein